MPTQVQLQSSLQRKIDDYNRGQLVARLDHSCNHPAVLPSSANFESLSYRRGYIEYLKRYRLGIEYTASYTIDAGRCTMENEIHFTRCPVRLTFFNRTNKV